MYLNQIFLIFVVFVYVAHTQIPSHPLINKETKPTGKSKGDVKHDSPDKKPFIAKVPVSHKNNSEETKGLINKLSEKNNSSYNNTSNQTAKSSNVNLEVNKTIDKTNELTSGAISRGILVFVGFSFLFILYVGIKTYRKKTQDKRLAVVRKYGVRARRSDVEMEPLPLSDDDDDETVFDLTASRSH